MAKVNKEALSAVENLMQFDFSKIGYARGSLLSAKSARSFLENAGIPSDGLSDVAAKLVVNANTNLEKSASAIREAALSMGILSSVDYWKAAIAGDGKAYKNENAFLRDMFPGYAVSTTSIYADVGKTIYLPILQHKQGYEGLEDLLNMSPSVVKGLLKAFKSEQGLAMLPSAVEKAKSENNGKLNTRLLNAIAKGIKDVTEGTVETAELPDGSEKPEQTAADLQGHAVQTVEARIRMAFMAALNDVGELACLVPEQSILDFVALLNDGAGNATTAMTLCKELSVIVAVAVKGK